MFQNQIIMSILNRNQLQGMRGNVLELGLCRNGKMRRLYIEGRRQRWQEQAVGALGMGGGGE